jgi:hypothetical protein
MRRANFFKSFASKISPLSCAALAVRAIVGKLDKMLLLLALAAMSGLALAEDFYEGCSVTKGCEGFPANCVDGRTCTVAVSYEGTAVDKYKFEIMAASAGDLQYIAAGLSFGTSMNNASVMGPIL